jgi:hypothetical protein
VDYEAAEVLVIIEIRHLSRGRSSAVNGSSGVREAADSAPRRVAVSGRLAKRVGDRENTPVFVVGVTGREELCFQTTAFIEKPILLCHRGAFE